MRRPHGSTGSDSDPSRGTGQALDARIVRRLWRYVRPHGRLVALSLTTLLAASVAQLVQPYLIKVGIDDYIRQGMLEGLAVPAGLLLVALVAEFLLRFALTYVLERTGQNVVLDLRMDVFTHLQHLPTSFFDRNAVGKLMTRVTSDVEALNEAFTSGVVLILADLVKVVGIVAILLWMDWRLAIVTFAILPLAVALSWWFRVRIRRTHRQVRRMIARLNGFLQEHVSGMRLVQMFSREKESMREFEEVNRGHLEADLAAVRYDSTFSAAVELVGSIVLAAIIWAGGWRFLGGWITFGTLVAFIQYAQRFFEPVQELSQRYAVMQAAMAAAERIFGIQDEPATIVSPAEPHRVETPLRGEIAFEDVTFGYDPRNPVLEDVSFRVRPGERVAVVGWTGAGKSTLIRLLVRLYDIDRGRITLDGVDVRDYDVGDLRRSVGVVLQDTFLFAGTVEGNISLGDPRIGPERVRAAAEAVHADRFIRRLPDGYAEEVRERGSNFSVGEKQLLAFARALAFDPAVLVLDEATSSVDPATERRIQEALEVLLENRTAIIIAHRLATIRGADRILVMHHGRLVEQGSHDELMRIEDGIYRSLYTLQMSA
jgi:ATP-binding cassette subfamily B protein